MTGAVLAAPLTASVETPATPLILGSFLPALWEVAQNQPWLPFVLVWRKSHKPQPRRQVLLEVLLPGGHSRQIPVIDSELKMMGPAFCHECGKRIPRKIDLSGVRARILVGYLLRVRWELTDNPGQTRQSSQACSGEDQNEGHQQAPADVRRRLE